MYFGMLLVKCGK